MVMRRLNPFARHENPGPSEDVVVGLTPLGKTKAEQFAFQGPRFDVLAALNEAGPSSISELSDLLRQPYNNVKAVVRSLATAGYVRRVGGNVYGED